MGFPIGVMLGSAAGDLTEGLARVEQPRPQLRQVRRVSGRGADLALGHPAECPDPVDAHATVQQQLDEARQREVVRGVAELAVLARGADQALFLPVPHDPGRDPDLVRQPGDRDEFLIWM